MSPPTAWSIMSAVPPEHERRGRANHISVELPFVQLDTLPGRSKFVYIALACKFSSGSRRCHRNSSVVAGRLVDEARQQVLDEMHRTSLESSHHQPHTRYCNNGGRTSRTPSLTYNFAQSLKGFKVAITSRKAATRMVVLRHVALPIAAISTVALAAPYPMSKLRRDDDPLGAMLPLDLDRGQ